jgi:TolB-like protein
MQYKNKLKRKLPEIAQALKVAHVLEGSVQRSANRVRVSAQLIDARNDTHIWAEKNGTCPMFSPSERDRPSHC